MIFGANYGHFRIHGEIFYYEINDDEYFQVCVNLEDFTLAVDYFVKLDDGLTIKLIKEYNL